MNLVISTSKDIQQQEVIELYKANKWSSADKPDLLFKALLNSDTLITARLDGRLVGLGNAISDGYLVVYYPHLLIHPDFQNKGIGKLMMSAFQEKYKGFHQQMLTSDKAAAPFYEKCGFEQAGQTIPMWIYQGDEH